MPAQLVITTIPVFNLAAMVRQAVASVVAQMDRDFEVILVEDELTAQKAQVLDWTSAGKVTTFSDRRRW